MGYPPQRHTKPRFMGQSWPCMIKGPTTWPSSFRFLKPNYWLFNFPHLSLYTCIKETYFVMIASSHKNCIDQQSRGFICCCVLHVGIPFMHGVHALPTSMCQLHVAGLMLFPDQLWGRRSFRGTTLVARRSWIFMMSRYASHLSKMPQHVNA